MKSFLIIILRQIFIFKLHEVHEEIITKNHEVKKKSFVYLRVFSAELRVKKHRFKFPERRPTKSNKKILRVPPCLLGGASCKKLNHYSTSLKSSLIIILRQIFNFKSHEVHEEINTKKHEVKKKKSFV
jgi:hypothetical protein